MWQRELAVAEVESETMVTCRATNNAKNVSKKNKFITTMDCTPIWRCQLSEPLVLGGEYATTSTVISITFDLLGVIGSGRA